MYKLHPKLSSMISEKKITPKSTQPVKKSCSQMLAINLKFCISSDINKLTLKIPFESCSLINFPIPCNWQQLSSLLKPTVERKGRNLNENKRRRTIQNVCLVTMQSVNEGSLNTRTWKQVLLCLIFIYWRF